MTDSAIVGGVDGLFAATSGTKATLERVVVTGQAPQPPAPKRGAGVAAVLGANVTVTRSVLRDLSADGAVLTEADGTVELAQSIVRGVRATGGAARGYGIVAQRGGHVIARQSAVFDVPDSWAVLVRDEGSTVALTETTVLGPGPAAAPPTGPLESDGKGGGVSVVTKGAATLEGVAVVGGWGFGVGTEGGTLAMRRSLVDATRAARGGEPSAGYATGLTVNKAGKATVEDVTVSRSSASGVVVGRASALSGSRLLVRDVVEGVKASSGAGLSIGESGRVDLEATAVEAATGTGVIVTSGANTTLRLADSIIRGTRPARDGYGHGATARLAVTMLLERTAVVDNPGIGVAVDAASALLSGAVLARNGVGVHAQGGSFLSEATSSDELGEGELRVTPDTRFVDNGARVGTGEVPLPEPLLP